MDEGQKTLRMVVEAAIIKEALARATYAKAADMARDASGRQALMGLAQVEAQHEKALKELAARQAPDSPLGALAPSHIDACLEDIPVDPDWDLDEVLAYAVTREQKSGELYDALAETCQDPDAKRLFQTLAAQERQHEHTLHAIRDDRPDPP